MTSRKDEARKLMELESQLDEVERKIPLAAAAEADEHDELEMDRRDLIEQIAALRAQLTRNHNGDK